MDDSNNSPPPPSFVGKDESHSRRRRTQRSRSRSPYRSRRSRSPPRYRSRSPSRSSSRPRTYRRRSPSPRRDRRRSPRRSPEYRGGSDVRRSSSWAREGRDTRRGRDSAPSSSQQSDADAEWHRLFGSGGAGSSRGDEVDRVSRSKRVAYHKFLSCSHLVGFSHARRCARWSFV